MATSAINTEKWETGIDATITDIKKIKALSIGVYQHTKRMDKRDLIYRRALLTTLSYL